MKLFAFKPHPDVVLKNILTQPHSDSVITMTSTGRWGLLESWFSPGFGGEVSAGSQDRLSLHPSHRAIVFPSSSLATPLSYLKYVQLILQSFIFICLLCVWVGRAHTMEDRRPLSACWPSPSYSVSWDLNSGQQAWQQVLLLAESSDQPSSWYLINKHTVGEPSGMWNFLLPSHIEDDTVAFSYRFSFCLHKHMKISLVSTGCWLNKRELQRNEREASLGFQNLFL